ncbi:MAG: CapA family protein [Gammaproteobacteria bacterium]|nr:CapA family protein [Gammaproteobacteria bacterium]MDH4253546.1 CapA family protein [Gammaproteobacteria bacterium]MDH5310114.1 CapA family protein [Gammaproteobacteria bacterium]
MINNVVNNSKRRGPYEIALAGDLVLDAPDPDHWLSGIAGALQSVDLAIGHVEVPHTTRGAELTGDVPAPGAAPEAIAALRRNGFSAVTLAGNHIADQGAAGIEDTLSALADAGLAACGAGPDLEYARSPAYLPLDGCTVAILSYNCVGPEASWASDDRAGCAFLRIETEDGSPVAPLAPLQRVGADARRVLGTDVRKARARADIVIVALHKGIVHTPVTLAAYERPLAHLAVDCGADIVASHHAHIVKGIEVYRGKPIFHGLGNACVVTRALAPDQAHPERAAWARRRRELFGFEPDPAYELAPFHPEATNAMLGRVSWTPGERLQFGIVPVHVEAPGRPVLASGARAREVVAYVERITQAAGLPELHFEPAGDAWMYCQ